MPLRLCDVEVKRNIDGAVVAWLGPSQATNGSFLCANINHDYVDMRGYSWKSAREALGVETEFLGRLNTFPTRPADDDEIWDEINETYELHGLDLGIVSTVLTLSASGCIPITSCNGGCLGSSHHESYPLVVFYARSAWIPLLLEAAEEANVGLANGIDGALVVYSNDILRMPCFATAMLERSRGFRHLKSSLRLSGS